MPDDIPLTITELAMFRKELKKQEQALKDKRAKVEAFQGLPPVSPSNNHQTLAFNCTDCGRKNIELARHALQEARDQQMALIQLRERLLGKMVDGVS